MLRETEKLKMTDEFKPRIHELIESKGKHLSNNKQSLSNVQIHGLPQKERFDIGRPSVSNYVKEIKRNHIHRYPYYCNSCHKQYNACPFPLYKNDASSAQHKTDRRLVESRQGLDMDEETFNYLNCATKEGAVNNLSICHIAHTAPLITALYLRCIDSLMIRNSLPNGWISLMQLLTRNEKIISSMNIKRITK